MAGSVKLKKNLKIIDGIYQYIKDVNEYKEPTLRSSDLLYQLQQKMRNKHWKEAVLDVVAPTDPFLYKIITFSTRSDYVYLLDTDPKSTVSLDIGTGWGQSLDSLSLNSKEVWALDTGGQKLKFVKKRLEQDARNNVSLLRASILDTPFEDSTFDVLTMIGVLEWVPVSDHTKDPRKLQIEALKECKRIMKSGGQMMIAIENSNGIKYQLGEPDDHTGIAHISYLDRQEATKKLQAIRGEDYRTYTYDMDGYIKLLQNAGFKKADIEFYYPIPNYKTYSYLLPLKNIHRLDFIYKYLQSNLLLTDIEREVIQKELLLCAEGRFHELRNQVSSYFIKVTK